MNWPTGQLGLTIAVEQLPTHVSSLFDRERKVDASLILDLVSNVLAGYLTTEQATELLKNLVPENLSSLDEDTSLNVVDALWYAGSLVGPSDGQATDKAAQENTLWQTLCLLTSQIRELGLFFNDHQPKLSLSLNHLVDAGTITSFIISPYMNQMPYCVVYSISVF